MTKIYVVRHCEALGNVNRVFQGTIDLDISDLGAKQLEFLQKRFKNTELDKVYSSPLTRAYKTALAIRGEKDIPVLKREGLRELDGGVIEGRPLAETFTNNPDLADAWDNHPQDFAPQNGEKMTDAYERIFNEIKEIAIENFGKSVAVASHGGVIRCLSCRLLYGSIERLKDTPWCENTGVCLIEFDDDMNPAFSYLSDISHLPEEYVNKKSRIASIMRGSAK